MENPFMTRKAHDKFMRDKDKTYYRQRQLDKTQYEERVYKIRTELRRVLNKFAKVNVSHLIEDYNTWRIVLDFDSRPILFSLERGDDGFMIDMIAEELKCKIVRKLSALNVRNPESLGLER